MLINLLSGRSFSLLVGIRCMLMYRFVFLLCAKNKGVLFLYNIRFFCGIGKSGKYKKDCCAYNKYYKKGQPFRVSLFLFSLNSNTAEANTTPATRFYP